MTSNFLILCVFTEKIHPVAVPDHLRIDVKYHRLLGVPATNLVSGLHSSVSCYAQDENYRCPS